MKFSALPPAACLGLLASLLGLAACEKDSDTGAALPAAITFTQAGLYPEGTQYDSQRGRFLVSSQTAGRIGQVADDGTYSTFTDDDALLSSIGLNLDAPRNRLLVAVSNPGYNKDRLNDATKGKLAGLAIFDRSTGTKTQYLDLAAQATAYPNHFANDIAVDAQGNAYVTDSYAPVIYKVDNQPQPNAKATAWLTNTALAAPAGKFGLNGIVYHPSGYLLVAKSDEGRLLKVPIVNGSPGTLTTVALPTGLALPGADGLQLIDNTTLLVVCNAAGMVYRLVSADDFATVTISGTPFSTGGNYPTTLARRNGTSTGSATSTSAVSYVLYSHLDALQAMQTPPVTQFALTPVTF